MSTNDSVYNDLKPAAVWRHFAAFNDIPRPSQHEQRAREYVQRVAIENNALYKVDDYGNIVVYVNASNEALKSAPCLSFQSHLDMVCQNLPKVKFDPFNDPILARQEGNRIYAKGTTLGADNAIGASLMLALLTDAPVEHGPLELLFTVEEEIGLIGAAKLDAALITSRTMINLDSTSTTEITVGCAGGEGVDASLKLQSQDMPADSQYYQIHISGLAGGHSGVQIDEPRANAIKLLAKVLLNLRAQDLEFNLGDFNGGTAHNAIPRDATAVIAISATDAARLQTLIDELSQHLTNTWKQDEPGLALKVLLAEASQSTFDLNSTDAAIQLLHQLPHGVQQMSDRFEGKVETSCNLSNVEIADNQLQLHVSSRSLIASQLDVLQMQIIAISEKAGAEAQRTEGYPGWEPRQESPLCHIAAVALQKATGVAPRIEVIHAGVECGVIASKISDLDVISIGAELYDLHSPEESVVIPSVAMIWDALGQIVQEYAA